MDGRVLCTSRSVFRALLLTRYPHPSSQCPIHHLNMTWHENVNVLTALSRAFLLHILTKQRAWGLELTSEQKIEDWFGNSRFCLCRRIPFAQSSYWLINSYPAPGVQIVESAALFYLKARNRLINFCFLLSFVQILADTPLGIHDSPFPANDQDTVAIFPAPSDPTGKVYCPLLSFVRFPAFLIIAV